MTLTNRSIYSVPYSAYSIQCIYMRRLLLLIVSAWSNISAWSFDYDWQRLHQCLTPQELFDTVADYSENFPCIDCREHFNELMKMHPFPLKKVQTEADCRIWVWFTRNLVNVRLKKPWHPFDNTLCDISREYTREPKWA